VELYTVVLESDVPVEPRKYGDLVAPMLGVTRLEAKIAVRKGRGLLLDDIEEKDAQRVVEELARDGVRARAVRNADLPALAAPRKVTMLERGDGMLRYRPAGGDAWSELPWMQIDVVSLGAVALEGFQEQFSKIRFDYVPGLHRFKEDPGLRDLLRENLILKMRAGPPPADRRRSDGTIFDDLAQHAGKLKVYADLVDATRTLWLRVPMDEMGYARDAHSVKLGEAWGFHLLAQDLLSTCAHACTAVSLKFVARADIKDLVFLQTEEFNRYTAWHAVLHHLGMKPCANADTSSPSPEPPAPSTDAGSSSVSPPPEPPSTSS